MPPPPIQVFLTTIITKPTLRTRQEYILRTLQGRKIPFTSYDLASDEAAKALWRRKAPIGKQELPGILIGGQYPGSFDEFEEALEFGELDIYLRRNEDWVEEFAHPSVHLPAVPIGVPGAYTPSEMMDKKLSTPNVSHTTQPEEKPGGAKKEMRTKGEPSTDSLQDVKVSEQELLELVKELGLSGEDAKTLTEGLTPTETSSKPESSESQI